MDAVGMMEVTLFNDAGFEVSYGASFGGIGYGISLTVLHTFEVDDALICILNLSARYVVLLTTPQFKCKC